MEINNFKKRKKLFKKILCMIEEYYSDITQRGIKNLEPLEKLAHESDLEVYDIQDEIIEDLKNEYKVFNYIEEILDECNMIPHLLGNTQQLESIDKWKKELENIQEMLLDINSNYFYTLDNLMDRYNLRKRQEQSLTDEEVLRLIEIAKIYGIKGRTTYTVFLDEQVYEIPRKLVEYEDHLQQVNDYKVFED
ncbi:MAG: hypothetical protein ACRC41_01170 [Sarcina sp.]